MSPFSYVQTRTSKNLGELISYFRVYIPPIFLDGQTSNGGSLLLYGTTVVEYRVFGESFWVGEGFKVLIRYVIAAGIVLNYVCVCLFLDTSQYTLPKL